MEAEYRPRFEPTRYYETQARFRHAEVKPEWIDQVLEAPEETTPDESNPDTERVRHYRFIPEAGYYIRVVTEPDGRVHNAFKDIPYTRRKPGRPRRGQQQ